MEREAQRAEGRDGCRRSEFRKAEERAWFLVLSSLLLVLCSWDLSGGGVVNAGVNAGEAERESLGGKFFVPGGPEVERRGSRDEGLMVMSFDPRPSTLDYPSLKAKFGSCGPACHWMRAFRPRLFDKATSLPARVQDASAIVPNSTALM